MGTRASEDKAAILDLIVGLADSAQATIATTLREFDAPASVALPLRILALSEEPVTPRDLARRLGRDPSTASLTADKLEDAGLIARRPHPDDGRKRVLVLTDRGRQLWSAMRDRLHESGVFERLTRPQQRQLLDLLTRMRG
ncbi:MarR family transcriptional regulator [Kribbella lupini]|uniref:HTH marR-type domain-containing protein n=1 Tax=Kribbella lupini TaxID=291602 RepID=A0ABP4NFQ1_9ACTN